MTEGEENIIIKGVLLEAISRDFSEELSKAIPHRKDAE